MYRSPLGVILWHAPPLTVHGREVDLGFGVALLTQLPCDTT